MTTAITHTSSPACKGCDGVADPAVGAFCSADCLTLHYLNADFPKVAATWPPAGKVVCGKCGGSGTGSREFHIVRGHGVRNDCDPCNGHGFITPHCDGRGGIFTQPHTSETVQ